MRRTHTAGLALLLALAATTSACGSDAKSTDHATKSVRDSVSVTGDFGTKPTVKVDSPLKVKKTSSWVLTKGDGEKVQDGQTFEIQVTLTDARTGKTVISTYDQGQRPIAAKSTDNAIFPAVTKAITGQTAGSRVVVAAAADDAYGDQGSSQIGVKGGDAIIMVTDVLKVAPTDVLSGPKGTAVKPPAGTPQVKGTKTKVTGIGFAGTHKPAKLKVVTLVRGTGKKIAKGDLVTVNYFGALWGKNKPFDESYTKQPATFPIGIGSVIPAWDQGLVGVTAGSRVLILTPPALGYGKQGSGKTIPPNSTLAFVVDVLGVG